MARALESACIVERKPEDWKSLAEAVFDQLPGEAENQTRTGEPNLDKFPGTVRQAILRADSCVLSGSNVALSGSIRPDSRELYCSAQTTGLD